LPPFKIAKIFQSRERIVLFALVIKPDSLLHKRVYAGLEDDKYFAEEISALKERYGNLSNAFMGVP
jgi:hypothetical protein